jgi:transcriptional regulator
MVELYWDTDNGQILTSRGKIGTQLQAFSAKALKRKRVQIHPFPLLTERSRCMLVSVTEVTMSKPSDLVQGTLDLLLLKILALEPLNGYTISQRMKQVSGDVLQVSDGSLYPALHKLEQEGWITAEWKATENNRRAKFYTLTRLGRRQLEREAENWNRLSSAISQVLRLKEA